MIKITLNGNNDETNGYNSVIKNGTKPDANLVKSVISPIGTVLAWHKTFTNTPALPDGWVELDGSVLSDSDSPYNGQTLPDLNSTQRFIRGNTTSGSTGGADTHAHNLTLVARNINTDSAQTWFPPAATENGSTLPAHMEMVWIMRIK